MADQFYYSTDSLALGPGRGYDDGTVTRWPGRDDSLGDRSGENSRAAKLTREQVAEIRSLPTDRYAPGYITNAELGARYGVSDRTVRSARTGRSWPGVCPSAASGQSDGDEQ